MINYGIIVNTPGSDNAYIHNYIIKIFREMEKFNQINISTSSIVLNYNYDLITQLLYGHKNVICKYFHFFQDIILI
jgi:hypothetical protein